MNCCWNTLIFSIVAVILILALPVAGLLVVAWAIILMFVLIG